MSQIIKNSSALTQGYGDLALRHWRPIVISSVACGLIVAGLTAMSPRRFESSISLAVSPPPFKVAGSRSSGSSSDASTQDLAEMMPRVLSVEEYRTLALSDDLIQDLIETAGLKETGIEDLRSRLQVELVRLGSRSSVRGTEYGGVIQFFGTGRDPSTISRVVESWAELFKRRVDDVSVAGLNEALSSLKTMYSNAQNDLKSAEDSLAQFREKWNLDLLIQEKQSKEELLTRLQTELDLTDIGVAELRARLEALRRHTETEEKTQRLFQAPPPDVYWLLKKDHEGEPDKEIAPEDGLLTEVINPIYENSRQAAIQVEHYLSGLEAKQSQLGTKVRQLQAEIESVQANLAAQSVVETRLTRQVETFVKTNDLLAAKLEMAKIASENRISDIQILGRAVVPDRPIPSQWSVRILTGLLVGALIGLAYIVLAGRLSSGQTG